MLYHNKFSGIYYLREGFFFHHLFRWFQSVKKIRRITYSDFPGSYFHAKNEECCTVNNRFCETLKENIFVRIAAEFIQDDRAFLAIKKELHNRYVQHRVKAYVLLKYLSVKNVVFFLPSDNEEIENLLSPSLRRQLTYKVPSYCRITNRIKFILKNGCCIPLFPAVGLAIAVKCLFRGLAFGSVRKERFSFGLDSYEYGINWRRGYDEFFIADENRFHPKNILYVIRGRLTDEKSRMFFNKYHYRYVETAAMKIPPGFFLNRIIAGFILRSCLLSLVTNIRKNRSHLCMIPVLATLKMAIDAEIFYDWFDVKVFIARDEYSPFHILRTIIANRHGNKTIGFSHGDYCAYTEERNYIVFDAYALWGEFYEAFLASSLQYTKNVRVIGAGIYGLDKTHEFMMKGYIPEKYRELKSRYTICAIMGSTFSQDLYLNREMTLKYYKDVLDATEEYPEVYRIIKPKADEFNDPDFANLFKGRERVAIEDRLWTYRFLTVPDLIVCIYAITPGIEALMAGKKVLYYDVAQDDCHIYAPYYPYLVAKNEFELTRNLRKVLVEGTYIDTDTLRLIRKNHGFLFDGNCTTRFRKMCLDLLQEVSFSL
jgi:hypothetical protein